MEEHHLPDIPDGSVLLFPDYFDELKIEAELGRAVLREASSYTTQNALDQAEIFRRDGNVITAGIWDAIAKIKAALDVRTTSEVF